MQQIKEEDTHFCESHQVTKATHRSRATSETPWPPQIACCCHPSITLPPTASGSPTTPARYRKNQETKQNGTNKSTVERKGKKNTNAEPTIFSRAGGCDCACGTASEQRFLGGRSRGSPCGGCPCGGTERIKRTG